MTIAQRSDQRPLSFRRRADLEVYPQRRRQQSVWVIKDPVALKYFQLSEEEFAILDWMTQPISLHDLKRRFEARFAPKRITAGKLNSFIGHLHRNGLLLSEMGGSGELLKRSHDSLHRSDFLQRLANPLAIRFRGIDPAPLLDFLYPRVRWVFTRAFLFVFVAVFLVALTLLVSRSEQLAEQLPELNAFLSPGNLALLAVVMVGTKIVHELGHAMACRHFGGRCHELGLMLLVFMPCLYCNVSDSWKLSNRWHRAAIAAAGIIVEIFLASVATIIWCCSLPGVVQAICFNVMMVCSVGTILLNGNPLLRYDGYYILSDVLDVPNLWTDSRRQLIRSVQRLFLGLDLGRHAATSAGSFTLLTYAILSILYRVVVTVSIFFFIYRWLEPLDMALVAKGFLCYAMVGMVASPIYQALKMVRHPAVRRSTKPSRMIWSTSLFVIGFLVVVFVPLPCRLSAPAIVEPQDARRVYVSVPGNLLDFVPVGELVKQGQRLAQLENLEIEREWVEVIGALQQQELRVQYLESARRLDDRLASQLPAAREILDDLHERKRQLDTDKERLVLKAPADGMVLPPPMVTRPNRNRLELVGWSGVPLDTSNLGMALQRNDLFCLVGAPNEYRVAVFVEQSDLALVAIGQTVDLKLDIARGSKIQGTVAEISRVKLESVPAQLAAENRVATRADASGTRRPEKDLFEVKVTLLPTDVALLVGASGKARISTQWQPMGVQLYRLLSKTFQPFT